MANYPGSAPSFTTKTAATTIQSAHMNSVQDEIVAIGTELLTGATAYTPAWASTGGTPITVGNATTTGRYHKNGKLVLFQVDFTFGTTSNAGVGNFFTWTLPTTAATTAFNSVIGRIFDSGTQFYTSLGYLPTTTTFTLVLCGATGAITTGSGIGAGSPMVWASGDTVTISGWYIEA